MANNQTDDGIHDAQSKHPSVIQTNHDESMITNASSDISLEDHKTTVEQTSTAKSDDAGESTQSGTAQNSVPSSSKLHPYNKSLNHSLNEDDNNNSRERSLSSASSTSSSSSTTSDNQTSNIPYEILDNDDDDDDDLFEHTK